MRFISNLLFLLAFVGFSVSAEAGRTSRQFPIYEPSSLENPRHVQIPQWQHKDWYAEDWTSQRKGIDLVRGFYSADIFRDQTLSWGDQRTPALVVGPNFYRLSGFDKRRVTHIVDVVYGITAAKENGTFILHDWKTKRAIGIFDRNGLRLH